MKSRDIGIILIGIGIILTAIAGLITNRRLNEIDKKLDNVASETDAKIESLEEDFKEYRTGTKEIIDSIYNQLNEHKDNMNNEIERIDEDIKTSKANKKKQYTVTAKTTYIQNTDGLTASAGVNYYGEQKETYYNLNMSRVVSNAQGNGLEGEYWVRDDGCKMFGDYVIVAANQDVHPYGSTVETSLGTGIVLDTGGFASGNSTQVDIATDW